MKFEHIKTYFQNDDITFIENDGLKILWENKWIHIRKSNTEPIIRIISESKSNKKVNQLIENMILKLKNN